MDKNQIEIALEILQSKEIEDHIKEVCKYYTKNHPSIHDSIDEIRYVFDCSEFQILIDESCCGYTSYSNETIKMEYFISENWKEMIDKDIKKYLEEENYKKQAAEQKRLNEIKEEEIRLLGKLTKKYGDNY